MEDNMEISQKMKNRTIITQQSHYWIFIWRKQKNTHCSIIYNSQDVEAT